MYPSFYSSVFHNVSLWQKVLLGPCVSHDVWSLCRMSSSQILSCTRLLLQAVLALAASWTSRQVGQRTLTGIVIDSGDGVTHAIPVVRHTQTNIKHAARCLEPLCSLIGRCGCLFQAEGYVIGSCIKHIPIAGRDITFFIQQLLRDREVGIPPEQSLETAKAVKVPPHLHLLLYFYSSILHPPLLINSCSSPCLLFLLPLSTPSLFSLCTPLHLLSSVPPLLL